MKRWRWWAVLAVLAVLAAVGAGVAWLRRPVQPAPAEILDHANQVWGLLGQGAGVIYQKFEVMVVVGPVNYTATVELWRSADGTQARCEMTDLQGRLIYFMLRSGDRVWRSSSLATLPLTAVNAVYPEPLDQYRQELAAEQGPSAMLETAAGVDRFPLGGPKCSDLKCFLGDWSAEKGVSLARQKDVATPDGRQGLAVRIDYAGDPAAGEASSRCIVVVDPDSYLMLEYVDPSGNMLHLLDYRGLPGDEVPPDLFTGFPAGVSTLG